LGELHVRKKLQGRSNVGKARRNTPLKNAVKVSIGPAAPGGSKIGHGEGGRQAQIGGPATNDQQYNREQVGGDQTRSTCKGEGGF